MKLIYDIKIKQALRQEFVAQILFLLITALLFYISNDIRVVIVVSGLLWFLLTPEWSPVEGLQRGNNIMFLCAWALLSVSVFDCGLL